MPEDKPIAGSPAMPENEPPVPAEDKAPDTNDAAARRQKLHRRHMRALRDLLIRFGLLCLVVYILFFHLVGLTVMPSGDMYPRVDAGDLVMYYRLEKNIHGQDIVVFEKPTASLEKSYHENTGLETAARSEKAWWRRALDWLGFRDPADPPMTLFICRVVARPGDTVEISGERLVVNGNTIAENDVWLNSTPEYEGFVEYPLTLGKGQYFVLADRRNGGADSRFFGAVDEEDILGTVITIVRRNKL